jgi:L-ascorbate metabolism protein UlaG (beta-lactamase superfamily)
MQILWKGQACFSLTFQRQKQEQVKIIIDPFDDSLGLRVPSFEADVVLSTHDHFDHNNIAAVKGDPFVVTSPGEYEVKDVFIRGIQSFHDDAQGKERGVNTIFVLEAEGMRVCHMGDFGQHELVAEQVGEIGNIDVLFVPVGGTYTIDGKQAAKIVGQIEPRMVIPMHYALPNLKVKLAKADDFLEALGIKGEDIQNKLTVKMRDLPAEETKVVVLKPG